MQLADATRMACETTHSHPSCPFQWHALSTINRRCAPLVYLSGPTPSRRRRARAWMGNRVSWHNRERGNYGGRAAGVAVGVFAAWSHTAVCYHKDPVCAVAWRGIAAGTCQSVGRRCYCPLSYPQIADRAIRFSFHADSYQTKLSASMSNSGLIFQLGARKNTIGGSGHITTNISPLVTATRPTP